MTKRYFAVFSDGQRRDKKEASFLIIRQSETPPIDEFWGRDLNHHTTPTFRQGRYPIYTEIFADEANQVLAHWRATWHSDNRERYAARDEALARHDVTYYALLDYGHNTTQKPSGIVRSTRLKGGGTMDEMLTVSQDWWPTEFLRMYARGHMDTDYEEITIDEGEAIAERWRDGGTRG